MMIRFRLRVAHLLCRLLLPKGVWVGRPFGVYTRQCNVVLGRMDDRGVLQGMTVEDWAERLRGGGTGG
jgi:hypothetical protein